LLLFAVAAGAETNVWPVVELQPTDRILVLAPHPDDEVIACGGMIQQALAKNLPVRVVFLTYGDNNEWSFMVYRKRVVLFPRAVRQMGAMRHDEALAAGKLLGLKPAQELFLGYPDFGTLKMWQTGWDERPSFRSMLTRVRQVPYPTAFRPGAPYKAEEILRDLTQVLRTFQPTKVFVSHPADTNPDHRALYLFTQVALWDLEKQMCPEVFPYLIHYANWPLPRGARPTLPMPPPKALTNSVTWRVLPLTPAEVKRKQVALKAHQSQLNSARAYLETFVRAEELFGDYPTIAMPDSGALPLAEMDQVRLKHTPLMPDALTASERARFVGIEWRYVSVQDKDLVLAIHFDRPLAREVEASIYLFGYRHNYPFAQMPKLHLKIGESGSALYDQARKLPRNTARIERDADDIIIRIPLKVLGTPHRLLTSARTYIADVPLDWVSWRVLELR
jgi:LmbE family N-acetylglucosaminyl deacetylase